MNDIKNHHTFAKVEPVEKGISGDKKYYIETIDGQRLILRISDVSEHDRKKAAYGRMKQMDAHNVPMSRPVDFGICDDGQSVYQLLSWCDGESLDDVFGLLSEREQYCVGTKAGRILRKIHSVPVAKTDTATTGWHERYSTFIDESIGDFHKTGVKVDNAGLILDYFNNNRHLLKMRPQCYLHGDYHVGNLMITSAQELSVIDWEIHLFNSYGDPWHEVGMRNSPHFSTGFIRGYFDGEPPPDYWNILAVYESIGAISNVTWAYYHHPEYLSEKVKAVAEMLVSYDNMQSNMPMWYQSERFLQ